MTVNVYNNFNNGDVHFSRFIIKIVSSFFPQSKLVYRHKNKIGILKDIENIKELPLDGNCEQTSTIYKIGDELYINTWYGQDNLKFFNQGGGCTLQTINLIIKNIISFFNKNVDYENCDLYPEINFNNLKLPELIGGRKILINNGPAMSGQANNMDLNGIIDILSSEFPNITFYVTNKFNSSKKNILFTEDITKISPDLLEIAYISTKCDIIVGRASGPYSFSMIKDNIMDKNKTFIAVCNTFIHGIWDKDIPKCNYIHYPKNDANELLEIIKKHI